MKNIFDENSQYAMSLSLNWQFAGENIPPRGHLISTINIRMQILIPQLNTENFYKLGAVDSFNINSCGDNKYHIDYDPFDSVTLFLIKKPKGSEDDITEKADILLPINAISSSDFVLDKSIVKLDQYLSNNLVNFLDYDYKKINNELLNNVVNKDHLSNIFENIKNKISSFLNKVHSKDISGLISEYDYIETYSLRGIIDAVNENKQLYEKKKNFDNLQLELQDNKPINHKKIKL